MNERDKLLEEFSNFLKRCADSWDELSYGAMGTITEKEHFQQLTEYTKDIHEEFEKRFSEKNLIERSLKDHMGESFRLFSSKISISGELAYDKIFRKWVIRNTNSDYFYFETEDVKIINGYTITLKD